VNVPYFHRHCASSPSRRPALNSFLLLALVTVPSPPLFAEPGPAAVPVPAAFLYQPAQPAVLADIIPFYWHGEFHLLYLQGRRNGFDWAQLVTRDFTSARYTGIAIPGSDVEGAQDHDIFTGSVIEKDGLLYAFYTGHNPALAKQGKPDQVIMRATSRDAVHWTKDPQFRFSPAGDPRYRWPAACRDPFLFWNPVRKEFGMDFTSSPSKYPVGGVGYAGSPDLDSWRLGDPLSASGRFPGYECSDLFRIGDRWYLLFSTYAENPGWATRYMIAPSIDGPWQSPVDDFFDGSSLYAAKTVTDGARRFLCGTLARRALPRDDANNGWAGRLLTYEIVPRHDGTLGVRIPPEVESSFGPSSPVRLSPTQAWETIDTGVRSTAGRAHLDIGKLPNRCLLTVQLTLPQTGRIGIWLGGKLNAEGAYRYSIDVGTRRLVFDHGKLPLGLDQEKERNYRPLDIRPGDRVTLKVVLDGDAAVACVNDTICLSTRIYNRQDDLAGLWTDTVGAEFHDLRLATPPVGQQIDKAK
jgi:beta-fructofuranosidase